MAHVSRAFRGKRAKEREDARLPAGQYLVDDFPVLSAGPTPHIPLDQWTFTIQSEVAEVKRWSWESFRSLPTEELRADIHCVTKWSKLDTTWGGRLDRHARVVDAARWSPSARSTRTCRRPGS